MVKWGNVVKQVILAKRVNRVQLVQTVFKGQPVKRALWVRGELLVKRENMVREHLP